MTHEPRGKVQALLDAMSADPKRIWSAEEAAKAMGVPAFRSTLLAYTDSVCRKGLMFRRMAVGGDLQFRLTQFDVSEAASVWKAPQMVPPRGTPAPAVGKAETKLVKIRADIAADMEPRGERCNRVLVDRLQEAMPQWTPPAVAPTPEPTAPPEAAPVLADASIQEAAEDFNATVWLDGDVDLYGLTELEDGGHRIGAKDVARLRRLIAWMPA